MESTAKQFGTALDNDDFALAQTTLSDDCRYETGTKTLIGPEEICNSYEVNMIAGRKKFDELEWGKCRIEKLNEYQFYVHFCDHLTKNGITHTYRCKQKLTLNEAGKICLIEHEEIPEERKQLNGFYKKVGLK